MHELSVAKQLAATLDDLKTEQNLSEIREIILQIGEMSDVIPNYLTAAWEVSRESLGYKDTIMTIEVLSATARCTNCGHEDLVKHFSFTCPKCDSPKLKILTGREFIIKSIEAK